MARRRFPQSTFDTINVTPLIDTLFFLLIIFMITAPLLEYSVDVSPPQMTADTIRADEKTKIINIRKDGSILFERTDMTREALSAALLRLRQDPVTAGSPIFLRADRDLTYGSVMDVMRLIRNAGFTDVKLVMEEEPR